MSGLKKVDLITGYKWIDIDFSQFQKLEHLAIECDHHELKPFNLKKSEKLEIFEVRFQDCNFSEIKKILDVFGPLAVSKVQVNFKILFINAKEANPELYDHSKLATLAEGRDIKNHTNLLIPNDQVGEFKVTKKYMTRGALIINFQGKHGSIEVRAADIIVARQDDILEDGTF